MSDMNLLLFGAVVFGLMLIGVGLTITEFRRLSKDNGQSDNDSSSGRAQNRN